MVGFRFKRCHTNYQNGDYMGSLNKKASGTQCFYNCFGFVLRCNVIRDLLPSQKVVKSNVLWGSIPYKIIMNFYSPVSNTRGHSIGHKMRIARIGIQVDS